MATVWAQRLFLFKQLSKLVKVVWLEHASVKGNALEHLTGFKAPGCRKNLSFLFDQNFPFAEVDEKRKQLF
jgi:hypothetical protein